MADWPDWYQPVSVMEWEAGNLDVNIQTVNTTINVQPAQGAVFQISGDVNITNTQLDVNVINSTLNITGNVDATIQGTASVSIDSATITVDVATVRETRSKTGAVFSLNGSGDVSAGGFTDIITWTNNLGFDVFIEGIGGTVVKYTTQEESLPPGIVNYTLIVEDGSGNTVFSLGSDYYHLPVMFDPALRVQPGWKITLEVVKNFSPNINADGWILLSYDKT